MKVKTLLYIVFIMAVILIFLTLLIACNARASYSSVCSTATTPNISALASLSISSMAVTVAKRWDKFSESQYGDTTAVRVQSIDSLSLDPANPRGRVSFALYETLFTPDLTLDNTILEKLLAANDMAVVIS